MNRGHFLDAQLWMRRAAASDWNNSKSDEDISSSSLLLPPAAPVSAQANAAATAEATAWCCFHVGARYCVFRASDAGEDQTQFQFELLMPKRGKEECQLLVRFDAQHVYVVDLRQILSVVLPKPAATLQAPQSNGTQPVTQQQQQEAPPFGCLEFENVSLRVWMDIPNGTTSMARQMLQHALGRVSHCMIKARGQQSLAKLIGTRDDIKASWRDAFRHNEWLVNRRALRDGSSDASSSLSALSALQMTPDEFLKRARRILKKDADFETVKVTCWKIFRSTRSSPRKRRKRSEGEGEGAQANDGGGDSTGYEEEDEGNEAQSKRLSEMDLMLLLTELAHIFGEEHDGVNELLGFSSSAACAVHDRCYELHPERVENRGGEGLLLKSVSTCVTSKWQAWDEYLEVSAQALDQTSSRRIEDESKSSDDKYATIYAAAAVFQRALVDEEDVATWQQRTKMQRNQINSFERVGFSACFPDCSSKRRKTLVTVDARHLLQQQLKAEQMFAVLLEKRKQLVRDELALALLPRRAPPPIE